MEVRHLRYFVAVAEAGSLTVVAEKTAQPSQSRQIRFLWALRLRAEVRAEYYSPNPEMWLHWPDFLGLTRRSGEYPAARLAMTREGRHD
jgi:hypothetical protein